MKLIIAVKIESDHNDFELRPTSKLTFLTTISYSSKLNWLSEVQTDKNEYHIFSIIKMVDFVPKSIPTPIYRVIGLVSLFIFLLTGNKNSKFSFFSNSKEFFEHVIYLRVTVRFKFTSALDIWLHWNRLYKT